MQDYVELSVMSGVRQRILKREVVGSDGGGGGGFRSGPGFKGCHRSHPRSSSMERRGRTYIAASVAHERRHGSRSTNGNTEAFYLEPESLSSKLSCDQWSAFLCVL